jgi:ribosomal protein S16
MQNHGSRNFPEWWIVIGGHYRNPKGRYIERVGTWLQRGAKTVQRSIIMNKPRIRYWLAMGAQPTPRAWRLLSYFDLWPKPLIPYGTATLYPKPERTFKEPRWPYKRVPKKIQHLQNEVLRQDALNKQIRELKAEGELMKNIGEIDNPEFYESDIEDKDKRTNQFYTLRTKFLELEKDTKKLNTTKRELIFRKMNKLATKGIEEMPKDFNPEHHKLLMKKIKITNPAEFRKEDSTRLIQNQAKYGSLMEEFQRREAVQKKNIELSRPISQYEWKALLVKEGMSPHEAEEESQKYFEIQPAPTILDWQESEIDMDEIEKLGSDKKRSKEMTLENVYVPSEKPITPFPNMSRYDPNDYYDYRPGYSEMLNSNKYYNTMETNSYIIPPKKLRVTGRYKSGLKRHRKHRVCFSTVNSAYQTKSYTPFACQPSLTQAYTGLMKKIGF